MIVSDVTNVSHCLAFRTLTSLRHAARSQYARNSIEPSSHASRKTFAERMSLDQRRSKMNLITPPRERTTPTNSQAGSSSRAQMPRQSLELCNLSLIDWERSPVCSEEVGGFAASKDAASSAGGSTSQRPQCTQSLASAPTRPRHEGHWLSLDPVGISAPESILRICT